MLWENKFVYKLIMFASLKHKKQMMKYPEDTPYIAHCVGVMMNAIKYANMMQANINWNLLIGCALLHDVIEDTNTKYEEINYEFGKEIADGVLALTKNKKLPKQRRMIDSISRIKLQPLEVKIVKLSDRLFNMKDRVVIWDKIKLEEYKKEAELICKELGEFCLPLKKDLELYIKQY